MAYTAWEALGNFTIATKKGKEDSLSLFYRDDRKIWAKFLCPTNSQIVFTEY